MNYKNSLKSLHWRDLKISIWKSTNKRCEICKFKGKLTSFNLHHRHYDSVGNESRNDVLLLCKRCHKKLHKLAGTLDVSKLEWAYRELAKKSGRKKLKKVKSKRIKNKVNILSKPKKYGILGSIQAKKNGKI